MPAIASGTTCFFHQNTAPIGWTKLTDLDDHGLRITTTWGEGSQGNTSAGTTIPFSTLFSSTKPINVPYTPVSTSSQSTTITDASTPPHTHKGPANGNITATSTAPGTVSIRNAPPGGTAFPLTATSPVSTVESSTATGSGSGHTHPMSLSSASLSGTLNLAVKYVDVIRATRN